MKTLRNLGPSSSSLISGAFSMGKIAHLKRMENVYRLKATSPSWFTPKTVLFLFIADFWLRIWL
jgi:hypothetical protein